MASQMVGVTASDPVQLDAKHYTVEAENDRVRVVRVRYGPREKSTMHGHPATIAVFLTDARFKFTYPDGRSEEIAASAGQVMSMDAFVHDPENLTDRPFEGILIELKG